MAKEQEETAAVEALYWIFTYVVILSFVLLVLEYFVVIPTEILSAFETIDIVLTVSVLIVIVKQFFWSKDKKEFIWHHKLLLLALLFPFERIFVVLRFARPFTRAGKVIADTFYEITSYFK